MKKIDLQQMSKDLQSVLGYKNGVKIDDLIKEFYEVNSKSTMIAAELTSNLAKILYEKGGDVSLVDVRSNALFFTLNRKKEIIEEVKMKLMEIEREIIFQEEALGSSLAELKSDNKIN